MIDCGYGVARQLEHAGVKLNLSRYVLLPHQHSDHNLEYGPMRYGGWATGLKQQVDVYGPPPLTEMTTAFVESMKFDIDIRIEDEGKSDLSKLIVTHEFDHAGLVLQNDDVKITSLRVRHPPITQSYAYLFDTADRSIVLSGDTTYLPEVLVHEALYLPGVDAMVKRVPQASRHWC